MNNPFSMHLSEPTPTTAPAQAAGQPAGLVNVAARLAAAARTMPDRPAVVAARPNQRNRRASYNSITFAQLDERSDRVAAGLRALGVLPGTRLALLVKPGIDFIMLVFALFKSGAVIVLIDPGMGRRNLVSCLEQARPEGFVAIPLVHLVRRALAHRFRQARVNVVVADRWTGSEITTASLASTPWHGPELAATRGDDPAAIIFTSGSTGPPKGVLYTHANFDHQVCQIRDFYGIEPGQVDLACFPLFGLFNSAMGVTTVIPDMDASRPARVDPGKIIAAVRDCHVTQSFASPAVWNRVACYCAAHGAGMPALTRVMSAGAPVTTRILESMKQCIAPGGEVHTPYGATEALPVASIAASEVLSTTAHATARGAGVCVGRRFSGIDWRIIRAVEGPIAALEQAEQLGTGQIGELIVRGPVVTRQYVTRTEFNALAKIADGSAFWHRMGDVGYLDDQQRFWYCGRLSQRVLAAAGEMYTECCEAILNNHPAIFRSALVGIGPAGSQRPVMICEPWPGHWRRTANARRPLLAELRTLGGANPLTRPISDYLLHRSFPVDVRHNAKIVRERLALWAAARLR